MSEDACRADVWLWRARFFKTRSLAAKFVDEGRVRLTRAGQEGRLDKCARPVKVGDSLVLRWAAGSPPCASRRWANAAARPPKRAGSIRPWRFLRSGEWARALTMPGSTLKNRPPLVGHAAGVPPPP